MDVKLALPDDLLMKAEKPARYIGGEVNCVYKDKNKIDIRFAVCFPDVYEIGMSHLGIQILYDMFNKWDDTWCERVYSPWIDVDREMRDRRIPLFALESQDRIKDFDFLGITLQYEMCYTNVVQILDLSNIPFINKDRTWDDPIVIGGGPCSYNPEPIADFFDLFYIGEGETRYRELLDLYKKERKEGASREEFLEKAGKLPGIYAPMFYEEVYNEDGTIKERIAYKDMPPVIKKEIVKDLSDTYYPDSQVVPYIKCTQDRVVLEIQRGCIRGCRFCQAGQIYRPVRERNVRFLKEQALKMLDSTGYDEITLSSLSSSDYSNLPELLNFLIDECEKRHVNISLPSLRIDAFSLDVMNKVQDIKKSSLTFAPEAGSQRLRNVINKGLTEEVILNGAIEAFKGGWTRVKLYFMLGLPTETKEDIEAIGELANKIAAAFFDTVPKEKRREKIQIVVSTSFFIPKPFTPLQFASMHHKEDYIDKAYITRSSITSQLNQRSIKYNWHEADVSFLEGIMARGDRRVGRAILAAYQKGCMFDSWSEYYHHDLWMESFKECNVDPDFYTVRKREITEVFPWDFIDIGVSKEHLIREWKNALAEKVTPNCRDKCSGCGAGSFECGICVQKR